MSAELASELASKGIITMEDLAEQAVDDLLDFAGVNEEVAAKFNYESTRTMVCQ